MDALHKLWDAISVFWKTIAAISGGVASLAAGWKPAIASWNWAISKHDNKVWGFFEESLRALRLRGGAVLLSVPVIQIATHIGRSEISVRRSLRRLEKQGKVVETPQGWNYVYPLPSYTARRQTRRA
jgi:hypothetical protein